MQTGTYKGLALFALILGIMLIISLAAVQITGSMGIEERFTTALGLSDEHEEDEYHSSEGHGGFLIEGNIPAYLLILGMLLACSLIIWRRT